MAYIKYDVFLRLLCTSKLAKLPFNFIYCLLGYRRQIRQRFGEQLWSMFIVYLCNSSSEELTF